MTTNHHLEPSNEAFRSFSLFASRISSSTVCSPRSIFLLFNLAIASCIVVAVGSCLTRPEFNLSFCPSSPFPSSDCISANISALACCVRSELLGSDALAYTSFDTCAGGPPLHSCLSCSCFHLLPLCGRVSSLITSPTTSTSFSSCLPGFSCEFFRCVLRCALAPVQTAFSRKSKSACCRLR